MKKIKILISGALLCSTLVFLSCEKTLENNSIVQSVSIPEIVEQIAPPVVVLPLNSGMVDASVPDDIAVAVDSILGFENGYGGLTGHDTLIIKKSDLQGFPDTTSAGAYPLTFSVFNKGNYIAETVMTILIVSPLDAGAEGPTDLTGSYIREATGYLVDVSKVGNGAFLVSNVHGAAGLDFPHVLYNFKNASGSDSLVSGTIIGGVSAQLNACGNYTKLVLPSATPGSTLGDYESSNPEIVSTSPFTMQWKTFTFARNRATQAQDQVNICGNFTATRIFVKQ